MPDATAGQAGEAALIAAVTARLPTARGVPVGPGDDAAVVLTPDGRVVATTDVLVEGVHFRRDWSSAHDVGVKAAAANLADVAAMGAVPTALLVGLVAPAALPVAWVTGLADGLTEEAARTGAVLVGGDTVSGPVVVVSVTALGDLQGRAPVLRSGARSGDVVVVAGTLGGSALGLAALLAGGSDGPGVAAHRRPRPPYAAGPVLADAGATAMCDVSDGLVVDLLSLCTPSGVAVELDVDALPGHAGASREQVLHGGEDHALLATVPPAAVAGLRARGVVPVGRVLDGSGLRDLAGAPLVPRGWEHFPAGG